MSEKAKESMSFIYGVVCGVFLTWALFFIWPYHIGEKESDKKWRERLSTAGYEYRETILKK